MAGLDPTIQRPPSTFYPFMPRCRAALDGRLEAAHDEVFGDSRQLTGAVGKFRAT
jgi:hypothetical protein